MSRKASQSPFHEGPYLVQSRDLLGCVLALGTDLVSGIAGIFNRDARPAAAAPLRLMLAAASHRGPDGVSDWTEGPLAIGHQWLRLGTHQSLSSQWLVDPERRCAVTLDGRLDNRAEIAAACGHHLRTDHPGDADLVLCAYLEWREQSAGHLLGDFALAVWDGERRQLFCARDVMGVKPFYYFLDRHRFVWASDLRQLLAADVRCEPNEAMVGEYLACAITSHDETLYRGIMRLPSAHWMTVTAEGVRTERYWRLNPDRELAYRTDDEYAEHFASSFRESVACRAEGIEPIGAYLSGGLDSSSVVGMARSLGRDVESFSLLFPNDPDADERTYIDDVVEKWRLTAHAVSVSAIDGTEAVERSGRRADVMELPSDLLGERLLERMRERSVHVALTGMGGDYGLSGSFFHYADLLGARDWRGFLRQLGADRRTAADSGWSVDRIFAYGVRPLLPAVLRAAARPLAERLGWSGGLPNWIGDELVQRTALRDRVRPKISPPVSSHCRRYVCDVFESGWSPWFVERVERSASECLVEHRHPFLDRRLVEFVAAIPEHQRWRGATTKFVLRKALRPLLPDSVYARASKADFSACVVDAIEQIGGMRAIDALQIASIGWVDQAGVSAVYRDMRRWVASQDERCYDAMFRLWLVLGVDQWYRANFAEGHRNGRNRAAGSRQEAWGRPAHPDTPTLRAAGARRIRVGVEAHPGHAERWQRRSRRRAQHDHDDHVPLSQDRALVTHRRRTPRVPV